MKMAQLFTRKEFWRALLAPAAVMLGIKMAPKHVPDNNALRYGNIGFNWASVEKSLKVRSI